MNAKSLPKFTRDDVSAASGLQQTQIENLVRLGLAPLSESKGRGSARQYGSDGLAQFAVIGAFFGAGIEVVPAARLAVALRRDVFDHLGHLHDNLDDIFLRADGVNSWVREVPYDEERGCHDRYGMFEAIRKHNSGASYNTGRSGDAIIEIIDRTYVFTGNNTGMTLLSPFGGKSYDVAAEFRLVGWERGSSDVCIIPLHEELPSTDPWETKEAEWRQRGQELEAEYHAARDNAVSAIRLNVSCAIRRGFEAVFQRRISNSSEIAG
ncbi:MAG: hypothetical protein H6R00_1867 [Proteobacteria bacterium]|nr:hypothetical protein [Pseudomonadota bacterium]